MGSILAQSTHVLPATCSRSPSPSTARSQVDGGLSEEAFVRKFSHILKQPPSELTRLFLKVRSSCRAMLARPSTGLARAGGNSEQLH